MKPDTSELVVLKAHNGRPSLFIELELEYDEAGAATGMHPKLSWLVFGYTEDFDLWLQMPLVLSEANELVDGGSPRMDRFVASRPGRLVVLATNGNQGQPLNSFSMPVPAEAEGVMWMLEAMVDHLEHRRNELKMEKVRRPEAKADLRAIELVLASV